MLKRTALAAGLLLLHAAAAAQTATVKARVGDGQTATAAAAAIPGEGVLLQIQLPDGRVQSFPQLGEELVPLSGKQGEPVLHARDLDRDGRDEIIVRGTVPPKAGAVLIFRYERTAGEFVPVQFTNDRDRTTPYMVVDLALPVRIDSSGGIEAEFMSVRPDGRKSYHVARYRWTGKGYSQSPDN